MGPDAAMVQVLRDTLSGRGLVLAYLFGSHARGTAHPSSDFDVAVLPPSALSALELGRLAELVGAATGQDRVDLVDLATAPPLLCQEVLRDGIVLLGSPEDRLDFELRVMQRVEDTRPLRRTQHELLREASKHGRST